METIRLILAYIAGGAWIITGYLLLGKKHFKFTFYRIKEILFSLMAVSVIAGGLEVLLGWYLYEKIDYYMLIGVSLIAVFIVFCGLMLLIYPQERPKDTLIELKSGEYDIESDIGTTVAPTPSKIPLQTYVMTGFKIIKDGQEKVYKADEIGTPPDKKRDIYVIERRQIVVGVEECSIARWKYKNQTLKDWFGFAWALNVIVLSIHCGVQAMTTFLHLPGELDSSESIYHRIFWIVVFYAICNVSYNMFKNGKSISVRILGWICAGLMWIAVLLIVFSEIALLIPGFE